MFKTKEASCHGARGYGPTNSSNTPGGVLLPELPIAAEEYQRDSFHSCLEITKVCISRMLELVWIKAE